ncbi:MAG: dihydroxyacetone kinase subunit L [Acidobacteria bacterium]|nr:MAG: dihydroxyacetone kinase subunit L [Acidobacteriota bacterium]
MKLTIDFFIAWLRSLRQCFSENRDYLTRLDSAIGDADHGINMERGFSAVYEQLEKQSPKTVEELLKLTAMTLIRTVGGASGPLYGTFFLRASAATSGKSELAVEDLVTLFEAGLGGIIQRGKAEPGDKTMVDAWIPAIAAVKACAAQSPGDPAETLQKAAEAAETGMRNTIPLQARKGRASYLGERSVGHQDPGATSTFLMLDAAARVAENS